LWAFFFLICNPPTTSFLLNFMCEQAPIWKRPIKAIGYALNKKEFIDAFCMRHGWKVKGIPTRCACGETNFVDHSLIHKLGGYTSMRHNSVRDSEAQIINERGLQRCSDQTHTSAIQWNRLWKKSQHCWQCKVGYDLWQCKVGYDLCERTVEKLWENFLYIRITHPTSLGLPNAFCKNTILPRV